MVSRESSVDADGESDDGLGVSGGVDGLPIDPVLFVSSGVGSGHSRGSGSASPGEPRRRSSRSDSFGRVSFGAASHEPKRDLADGFQYTSKSHSGSTGYHEAEQGDYSYTTQHPSEPLSPPPITSDLADLYTNDASAHVGYDAAGEGGPDTFDPYPAFHMEGIDDEEGYQVAEHRDAEGGLPIAGPSRLTQEDLSGPARKRQRTGSSITSSSIPSSSHYPSTISVRRSGPPPTDRPARLKVGRKSKHPTPLDSFHPHASPPTSTSYSNQSRPTDGPGPRPKSKSKPPLSTFSAARTHQAAIFPIGGNQFIVSANGKPPRDPQCGFCLGSDERNKDGQVELMLSCHKCGVSGHPSCMSMDSVSLRAQVRTYPWQCIECKKCEICDSKGEDNRLMFCDGCDRGWHSYCLNPPLSKPPRGLWKCPTCAVRESLLSQNGDSASSSNGNATTPSAQKIILYADEHERDFKGGRGRVNGSSDVKGKGKGKERASDLDDGRHVDTPNGFRGKGKSNGRQNGADVRSTPVIKLRISVPQVETPSIAMKQKGTPGRLRKIRTPVAEPETEAEEEMYEREWTPVPFGGIIEGADADTTNTSISASDKAAFEKSRRAADLKLGSGLPDVEDGDPFRGRSATPDAAYTDPPYRPDGMVSGSSHRPLRDRLLLQNTASSGLSQTITSGSSTRPKLPPASSSVQVLAPAVSEKIKRIRFGRFDIDTWYAAPYPEEYARVPDGRLWICEFCLKYMKSGFVAGRHQLKCKTRHPPGDEIYREGSVSVFEVDGRKNKIYCQNLCLIAKMFLDHKTLYYDVEPFLFYVMTEVDDDGAKFVGYFSKEKRSATNNVSCIMTLPVRQRKGWGNLLIDFSYLLSKKEGRTGSPEKPLSGLGALSYQNYWTSTLFQFLDTAVAPVTLDQICSSTSMMLEDVFTTLQLNDMIDVYDSAEEMALRHTEPAGFWPNGGVARQALSRNNLPAERTAVPLHYSIHWDPAVIQGHMDKLASKGWLKLRPEKLKYTPFLVTRVAFGQDGMLVSKSLTQVQADGLPDHEAPTVEQVMATGVSVEVPDHAALPYSEESADRPCGKLSLRDSPRLIMGQEASKSESAQPQHESADSIADSPPSSPSEPADEDAQDEDFELDPGERVSVVDTPTKQQRRSGDVTVVMTKTSPARRSSVRQGLAASLNDRTPTPSHGRLRETRGSSRLTKVEASRR